MAGRNGQGRGTACGTETETETESHRSAEGLRLRVADNKTGYFGVYLEKPSRPKPYQVQIQRKSFIPANSTHHYSPVIKTDYGVQTPCGPTILPRGAGKFSSASFQMSAVTPSGQ